MSSDESHLWDAKYASARDYDSKEDLFRFAAINPTVESIVPYLTESASVLEIGSGTGELILYLKHSHPGITAQGVDFSSRSVARSRGLSERFKIPVVFTEGDIASMPFPDETFDLVFGDQVIGHTSDIDLALSEIFRVTKKGGIVALSIANSLRPDGWYFNKTFSRNHVGYTQKGMFPWNLWRRVGRAGFRPLHLYGEMLFLFRNLSLLRSIFVPNSSGTSRRPALNPAGQSEKSARTSRDLVKGMYRTLERFAPAWTKVTIGIVARK